MTRDEIKQLLKQIKVFYSRFDSVEKTGENYSVSPTVTDSWYSRIGFMEYDRAVAILDRYIASDNGSKMPGISLWVNGGKETRQRVECSALLLPGRGLILWRPEGTDKPIEVQVTFNQQHGCWQDTEGRLWASPEEE